jgi:hypothetical protein
VIRNKTKVLNLKTRKIQVPLEYLTFKNKKIEEGIFYIA